MKSGVDLTTIVKEDEESEEENDEKDEVVLKLNKQKSISIEDSKAVSDLQNGKILEGDQKIVKEEGGLLKELEASSKGKVKGSLLMKYFKFANRPFALTFLFASFLLAQIFASFADVWVSYW